VVLKFLNVGLLVLGFIFPMFVCFVVVLVGLVGGGLVEVCVFFDVLFGYAGHVF
jgi:hypothetical protein